MMRAPGPLPGQTSDGLSLSQTLVLLKAMDRAVESTTCGIELRKRWLGALGEVLDAPLVVELRENRKLSVHDACPGDAVNAYLLRLARNGLPEPFAGPPSNCPSMVAPAGPSVRLSSTMFEAYCWSPYARPLREASLRDPVLASSSADDSFVLLLHRPLDRAPLAAAEANLIRLFVNELSRRAKSTELPRSAEELPLRLRGTLGWLLRGAAEKGIAAHLGLSVHTVHQYVKAIYRTYDVGSRGQLMARCLRADIG